MPMILNSMFTYVCYKYGFAHGFLINKVKITEDVACLHTVISALFTLHTCHAWILVKSLWIKHYIYNVCVCIIFIFMGFSGWCQTQLSLSFLHGRIGCGLILQMFGIWYQRVLRDYSGRKAMPKHLKTLRDP